VLYSVKMNRPKRGQSAGAGLGYATMVLTAGLAALPLYAEPEDAAPATTNAAPASASGDSGEATTAEGNVESTTTGTNAPVSAPEEDSLPPNPYQAIIDRNPFGLKPPPLPPEPPQPPAAAQAPPSALKLSGITTLLSGKKAMFVLQEPGKPVVYSDLLREGEKDRAITNLEVLHIDERAGTVQVKFGGKDLAMDFKSNGLQIAVGPAAPPPGAPGGPGAPTLARPGVPNPNLPNPAVGGTASAGGFQSAGGSGLTTIPQRPTRLPSGSGTTAGGFASGTYGGAVGNPTQTAQNAQQQAPALPPAEQVRNLSDQYQRAAAQGVDLPPPIHGL